MYGRAHKKLVIVVISGVLYSQEGQEWIDGGGVGGRPFTIRLFAIFELSQLPIQ